MSRTYRECAIEHLKQGNLCKGYVNYIVGEVEKLEKIEQIIDDWYNVPWGNTESVMQTTLIRIAEALEKE